MLDTSLIKKERKAPKKARSRSTRKKTVMKVEEPSFFDNFNHVAPLNWVPSYYQDQIKAAKPIRFYKTKSKKKKASLQ